VKKKYDQSRDTVRAALDKAGKEVNDLDAKTLEELKKLRDDSVRYAIGGLMTNLVSRYEDMPDVVQHLTSSGTTSWRIQNCSLPGALKKTGRGTTESLGEEPT